MLKFALAKLPTPILNSPDFHTIFGGSDGTSLPLDDQGLLRPIETIALKGTKFEILETLGSYIFRVKTADYAGDNLYVDMRFLEATDVSAPERQKILPSREKILHNLQALKGATYIWGGNWSPGIPQMMAFYPPLKELDKELQTVWSLQGVDCSGLLYEATEGFTPRNTSELVHTGFSLPIEGKSPQEIASLLEPLDLIVWKGHVVIALNPQKAIESRLERGVVVSNLEERLKEVMQSRKPITNCEALDVKSFVIKRWM